MTFQLLLNHLVNLFEVLFELLELLSLFLVILENLEDFIPVAPLELELISKFSKLDDRVLELSSLLGDVGLTPKKLVIVEALENSLVSPSFLANMLLKSSSMFFCLS